MDGCAGGGIEKFFYPGGPVVTSTTYRVMQYNITHQEKGWTWIPELFEIPFEERAANVANVIKQINPDVVLLAERFEEWAGIDTGAVAMENGGVNLIDLLGDSYGIAGDTITYNGKTVVNRVPIVYNSSKLKLVDSGVVVLTDEYPFDRSQNKRAATWAIFEDLSTGNRFAVFNAHWSIQEYKGNSLAETRKQQSKEMQALINDERFKDMPRIAGGDFNSQYHFDILQELLTNCGLTHADMAVNGKITWDSVDHIGIAGAEITAYKDWRFDKASDHPPIHVDFTITTTN